MLLIPGGGMKATVADPKHRQVAQKQASVYLVPMGGAGGEEDPGMLPRWGWKPQWQSQALAGTWKQAHIYLVPWVEHKSRLVVCHGSHC